MRITLAFALLLTACSVDNATVADDVDEAETADLAPPAQELEMAVRAAPASDIPLKAIWRVTTSTPCADASAWLPVRMQFDADDTVYMLFTSGYDDQTTWEVDASGAVQTGVRAFGADASAKYGLQPAAWTFAADGTLHAQLEVHDGSGARICSADVVAELE